MSSEQIMSSQPNVPSKLKIVEYTAERYDEELAKWTKVGIYGYAFAINAMNALRARDAKDSLNELSNELKMATAQTVPGILQASMEICETALGAETQCKRLAREHAEYTRRVFDVLTGEDQLELLEGVSDYQAELKRRVPVNKARKIADLESTVKHMRLMMEQMSSLSTMEKPTKVAESKGNAVSEDEDSIVRPKKRKRTSAVE